VQGVVLRLFLRVAERCLREHISWLRSSLLVPYDRGNAATAVRKILEHLGAATRPPRIAPARGPPLWETAAASALAGNDPHWELAAQPVPQIEFDQRIAW
jgi:hypothetical protein